MTIYVITENRNEGHSLSPSGSPISTYLTECAGSRRHGLGVQEHSRLLSPPPALMPMAFSPPSLPVPCPFPLYSRTPAPSCLPASGTSSCLGTSGPAALRHGELWARLNYQLTLLLSSGVCSKAASQRGFFAHAIGYCIPHLFFLLI